MRGCEAQHGGLPGGVLGEDGVEPGRSRGELVAEFDEGLGLISVGLAKPVIVTGVVDNVAVGVLVVEQEVEDRDFAELGQIAGF